MIERLIIGTKNNGLIKVAEGKYQFNYRKRGSGEEFKRTKNVTSDESIEEVTAKYKKWLSDIEEEYLNNQ